MSTRGHCMHRSQRTNYVPCYIHSKLVLWPARNRYVNGLFRARPIHRHAICRLADKGEINYPLSQDQPSLPLSLSFRWFRPYSSVTCWGTVLPILAVFTHHWTPFPRGKPLGAHWTRNELLLIVVFKSFLLISSAWLVFVLHDFLLLQYWNGPTSWILVCFITYNSKNRKRLSSA